MMVPKAPPGSRRICMLLPTTRVVAETPRCRGSRPERVRYVKSSKMDIKDEPEHDVFSPSYTSEADPPVEPYLQAVWTGF